MKTITLFMLNKELREHRGQFVFYNDGPYNLQRLFDIYSENEITSLRDLFNNRRDFSQFIIQNVDQFGDLEDKDINVLRTAVHRLIVSFCEFNSHMISQDNRYGQEKFAYIVEDVVKNNKKLPILDVGAGKIPYSSMIMGNDGYNVTSMDEIVLSEHCLSKNFNVKANRRYFQTCESLGDYGIVVGRRPCSAISRIVDCCAHQKKPYFIKLCGCDAPGETNKGWEGVLSNFDENIDHYDDYVFNTEGLVDAKGCRITGDDVKQTLLDHGDEVYEK